MIKPFIKTLTFSIGCAWALAVEAQTTDTVWRARAEKYTWGMEVGLISVWGYYERRLADQVTLRGEAGWFLSVLVVNGPLFIPGISVEPRWYYNLDKKMRKNNSIIAGNSGNFIALQMRYIPNMGVPNTLSSLFPRQEKRRPAISVLFMWGIRHDIGRGFNYELVGNVGFLTFPDKSFATSFYIEPYLRIGYRFVDNKK